MSVRSVLVDGRPLTWARLVELVPDADRTAPVTFEVARGLPRLDALRLQAWLVRRRVRAEIPVGPVGVATRGGRRHVGQRADRDEASQ